MTRWEWGGILGEKGEGFVGTIIKDQWTIMGGGWKQEGGVEGWGLGWGRGKSHRTMLEEQ